MEQINDDVQKEKRSALEHHRKMVDYHRNEMKKHAQQMIKATKGLKREKGK